MKERKKAAYGRFDLPDGTADDESIKGLFVIPFDQPANSDANLYCCKYILNHSLVLKPAQKPPPSKPQHSSRLSTATASTAASSSRPTAQNGVSSVVRPTPASPTSSNPLKKGLLGNILGAQRKTAQHLAAVPKSAVKKHTDEEMGAGGSTPSSQSAINEFREEVHQRLQQFQRNASQTVLRIPVSLAEITRKLDPSDHAGKLAVKMDVLKYIVYEATEEVGEDKKWSAHKECSEFLDEITIAVYKDGYAPPEILEEMMKVRKDTPAK